MASAVGSRLCSSNFVNLSFHCLRRPEPDAPGAGRARLRCSTACASAERVLSGAGALRPALSQQSNLRQKAKLGLAIACRASLWWPHRTRAEPLLSGQGPGPAAEPTAAESGVKLLPKYEPRSAISRSTRTCRCWKRMSARRRRETDRHGPGTNTDHLIHTARLYSTDRPGRFASGSGERPGRRIWRHATVRFQVPIEQTNAAFALVREVQRSRSPGHARPPTGAWARTGRLERGDAPLLAGLLTRHFTRLLAPPPPARHPCRSTI